METGIIGLPQVGKTSLFKILTHAHLEGKAGHTPTHVGVAHVPDSRLDKLAELFRPRKVIHATVQYMDVGGLVHDRARDAAFLAQLREVEALAHVVRVFENPGVPHSDGSIDPLRDVGSLELELMLADLDQAARRLERIEKDLKKKKDPLLEHELALLSRCRSAIEAERPLRELEFGAEERKLLSSFMFLSQKPMLYVLNLGDSEVEEIDTAVERHGLGALTGKPNTTVTPICGKIEAELAELEDAQAAELLTAYGLKESGLDRLINATYRLLGLISFFTCGESECRAWTVHRGATAPEAAGTVHSDFERAFIKAEIVHSDDLLEAGGLAAARERGRVKLEGREYVVEDG
ncbi:MAG TPA: redox-regulated ATPase YchF, partial [Candidatus Acidoferrales bacterium]|nr:redox-regulated ATPase YchF [Candidatus Acidoferrales bacterium]